MKWKIILPLPGNGLCNLGSKCLLLPAVGKCAFFSVRHLGQVSAGPDLVCRGGLSHPRNALDYLLLLSPLPFVQLGPGRSCPNSHPLAVLPALASSERLLRGLAALHSLPCFSHVSSYSI